MWLPRSPTSPACGSWACSGQLYQDPDQIPQFVRDNVLLVGWLVLAGIGVAVQYRVTAKGTTAQGKTSTAATEDTAQCTDGQASS